MASPSPPTKPSSASAKLLNPNAVPFPARTPCLPLTKPFYIFPRKTLDRKPIFEHSQTLPIQQPSSFPVMSQVVGPSVYEYFRQSQLQPYWPAQCHQYYYPSVCCYDVRSQMAYSSVSVSEGFVKKIGGMEMEANEIQGLKEKEDGVMREMSGVRYKRAQRKLDLEKWVARKSTEVKESYNGGRVVGTTCRPHSTSDIWSGGVTTVMIKNVPNQFKRRDLLHILDKHCVMENRRAQSCSDPCPSEYDFVYLPMDFRRFWFERKISNLGYAFVNFTTEAAATRFYEVYHCYEWDVKVNKKICEISCAKIQGKLALREAFKSKIFWCHSEQFLPAVLAPASDGSRRYKTISIGKRIATVPPKPLKRLSDQKSLAGGLLECASGRFRPVEPMIFRNKGNGL